MMVKVMLAETFGTDPVHCVVGLVAQKRVDVGLLVAVVFAVGFEVITIVDADILDLLDTL